MTFNICLVSRLRAKVKRFAVTFLFLFYFLESAFKARSFAIAFLAFFIFFAPPRCLRNGHANFFLPMFHHSLRRTSVARIGVISLGIVENASVRVLFLMTFCAAEWHGMCLRDM